MTKEYVKIVIGVPASHSDIVRQALGQAGAGNIGNYSFSSFSSQGIGRFKPEKGANPTLGEVGQLEAVEEERIETACPKSDVDRVLDAVKKVHPYEEIAIDVYPLLFDPSDISKNPYRKK